MWARLIPALIIVFWMGSLAWLGAVVWAPPESRMARIDPREVYEVFFRWNDSTSMTLLENGIRKGQITVSGGSGENRVTGEFSNTLSVSGTLEEFEEAYQSATVNVFWKGLLEYSEALKIQRGEFSFRMPRQSLSAHLGFSEDPVEVRASASVAGKEIFQYKGGDTDSLPLAKLPMDTFLKELPVKPDQIQWQSEARMGNFSFGGRNMRAYLLILSMPEQGQTLKVYLSEVGEPLRIETELGFEAVSEILVPLEAYRKQNIATQP